MVVGLLWMIYDIINAPEVDDNENPIFSDTDEDTLPEAERPYTTLSEVKRKEEEVSEVD